MNYEELKRRTNRGWNTWNTRNILSYSHLPEGFTISLCIKEFSRANMLRESLVGRYENDNETIFPDARSYDGSCTRLNLKYADLELDVRTTVFEDEQYIIVTPLKTGRRVPAMSIEACLLWEKEGSLFRENGVIGGICGGRRFEIFTTGEKTALPYSAALSPGISVLLNKPFVISTKPCSLAEAEALYAAAKEKLDRENNRCGDHSEAYTAMKTCLAWDTVYEPEHDRVCSPVSRIWNANWGGYVLFDWDTYFAALMASAESKELAQLNAIAITDEITESGFIPNFGAAYDNKSRDRTEPIVGAFTCLEIYKKYPEKWFCERVFPSLLRWNRWVEEHRMTKEGYLCWGSDPFEPVNDAYFELQDVDNLQGAAFESGMDNSPMYDDMVFDPVTHRMQLADVGFMGLYILDCRCMAELAKIVGQEELIPEFDARCTIVEQALMTMWDEDFGLFLNKNLVTGELSRRISPTNFYALHAESVTETQKRRMMDEHFYNPEEFWGDHIIPTIARNDPAFPEHGYWRGRVWAPTNYLAYIAMKAAGLQKECDDLARKSEELILKEWRLYGHVHENYSAVDGLGCGMHSSDKFYHWGGLLAYIALDNAGLI